MSVDAATVDDRADHIEPGVLLPPVLYVLSRWGKDTETFVRREARALAAQGATVSALSLKHPGPAGDDIRTTWMSSPRVAVGAARVLVRHPRRSGRVLWEVLRGANRHTVLPRLSAALIGMAWVGNGAVPRGAHLHAHFGWVAATASWAASELAGVPFTVVLHAFELHTGVYQDRFVSVPLRAAATVFTISERDRGVVQERWAVPTEVLRMGVPRAWTEEERVAGCDRQVIVVGSLTEKKGHRVLFEALTRTREPWECLVVGDGPLRRSLAAQVERLDLSSRVRFVGSRSEQEVRALLAESSVFCLPCTVSSSGDRDGIPVALMEAMAVGLPVVSTKVSAVPELVQGAGVLVEADRPDELAAALDLLADGDRRERLSRLGRERVRDSWTVEVSVRTLAAHLTDRATDASVR